MTAGLDTVAVRRALASGRARAARSGRGADRGPQRQPVRRAQPHARRARRRRLGDRVDLILDGGASEHGLESTIVALEPKPRLAARREPSASRRSRPTSARWSAAPASDRGCGARPAARIHYAPAHAAAARRPSQRRPGRASGGGRCCRCRAIAKGTRRCARSRAAGPARGGGRFLRGAPRARRLGASADRRAAYTRGGLGLAMMDRLGRAAARR